MSVKLKLDLHGIYKRGEDIDRAQRAVMDEVVAKKGPAGGDYPRERGWVR